MTAVEIVDLTPLIGKPGGPINHEEAERYGRHEMAMKAYDHLGARKGDDRPRSDVKPDCFCRYCRFYRGEDGVRLVMCEQDWGALSQKSRMEISESCAD
ncbi:MAG TPA: hypothetical protein VNA68_03015 [Candidatus Dormibacteraeota bacterium]|nr:hypothetical protein [Candidatus Dormibacteraeota bacterium]